MQLNDPKEIYEKIKKDTGKSDEELQQMKEDLKSKYQGLLSEVGANIMLSKKLNVNIDLKSTSSILTISELSTLNQQDNVSIYARIKTIPPVRTYKTKDGSEGKVRSIYLYDDTGNIRLNLWQDKISLIEDLSLEKNSLIFVKDAYPTKFNEKTELSLRYGGEIIKNPKDSPLIKELQENLKDISNISLESTEPIDVIGRITNIYPVKTFEGKSFDGKTSRLKKVINFEISDGIENIKCVAWDPWSSEVETNFSKGDLVKLNDVVVKEGKYGLELYINWNSGIVKNPKTTKEIPLLKDIISKDIEEGKISDLEDGKSYILKGVIVSINRNKLRFFKCPKCNERVHILNNEFICETCNEVVDPIVNLFGSISIDDGTGILKMVFFGDLVTKIFKLKKEDLKKELTEEDSLTIFDKLEDSLLGKKVSVSGRVKLNNYSTQLEMLADSVDFVEENS